MRCRRVLGISVLCLSTLSLAYLFVFISTQNQKQPPDVALERREVRGSGIAEVQVITAYSEDLIPTIRTKRCDVQRPDPSDIAWDNEQWQEVRYENVFLFSAYYDQRYHFHRKPYHFVRLIAVVRDVLEVKLTCYLWPEDHSEPYVVPAHSTELWVNFWPKGSSVTLYKSHLLSCPVPHEIHNKVVAVSISSHECQGPKTYLPVAQIPSKSENQLKDFAVCVKGIDYSTDISTRLVEWLELQFLLGADKVALYLFRVHPNIAKVLQYYSSRGTVQIVNLTLPGQIPNVPEERSQFLRDNLWQKRRLELVPYNDCLYQHLYTHRFVVLLDIDEAIIPVVHDDWHQLMDAILANDRSALNHYPSFSAQNAYFFDRFSGETENELKSIPAYYHMLRHVQRSANFSTPGFAVKSFVATNCTLAVFNHYALFPLYKFMKRNALISKSLAQLNHYRIVCPNTMYVECKQNFLKHKRKDTLIWKYKDILLDRVESVLLNLNLTKK